ncbi:xenotropic and polytropic retrovirus receptor 1 [Nilaparvata lugens]|uniref:xenotropic and polytropic retrovirus receptor 1 n=1 Tax=Nilaparvata lugens TaxID=108931 RepID=UPI00193EBC83|nr:xenotropic and polytropic retrovirus receptor 1 [Nilaparvata lugens]
MKFTEHLAAHITPEWRKQYVNYEEMKLMLYAAVEQSPSAELVEPDILTRYFAKFDEEFFHYCDKELAKINTFYSEKLAEATRKYGNLKSELIEAQENEYRGKERLLQRPKILRKRDVPARKIQELKLAFSEFYLSLILLQNYQNLNFTGFRKILKKHDKLLTMDIGAHWRSENVETAHFYVNKDIDRLIAETEATVTQELEGGDRQRAMKRLRVPPLGEQQSPWTTFKVGLFSGSFVVLLIAVILSGIFHGGTRDDWRVAIRLYRGPLLVVEFLFLMGVNVYGWRSSGVNHVLIFELDPRNHLSEQHIMETAAIFGVIWTLSVLSFLFSSALSVPPYVNPLALITIMALFLFNPTRTFRHEARFWVLRVLLKIIASPFFYVGFADFWLADQLTSLVPALLDLQYFVCFYITNESWMKADNATKCVDKVYMLRPIVACLPAWFRFAQCLRRYRDTREAFPHLANAAKYSTTFFVILFSFLHQTYSREKMVQNIPSEPGDDLQPDNPHNPQDYFTFQYVSETEVVEAIESLRGASGPGHDGITVSVLKSVKSIVASPLKHIINSYYYFAVMEDFILRFGWVLSMSLTEMGYVHGDLMVSILSPLEVFRRFVWNFFRLENEHLNNCGKFRAVRDISVAPMDSSDHALILRMMDEDDGVINRHKRKQHAAVKRNRLLTSGETTEDLE